MQKLKQPIKIFWTMCNSQITFHGKTPQDFKSRTDAAQNLGRLTTYSAERRRVLSIVTVDYPQTFLTDMFKCSKSTVTAARVHHILFGRGGVPPPSLKFTCQCVSQETLDQLTDFLLRDDISRPSSCRSVVVNAEESQIRYWQNSIRDDIQQYLLEFPGGVKCSFIYGHVPKNFRTNTMLAGLCNLGEDYGYSNFASLKDLVDKVRADCHHEDLSEIAKNIDVLQHYLKTKFLCEVCCLMVVVNINKLNRAKCNSNQGQKIFNHSAIPIGVKRYLTTAKLIYFQAIVLVLELIISSTLQSNGLQCHIRYL